MAHSLDHSTARNANYSQDCQACYGTPYIHQQPRSLPYRPPNLSEMNVASIDAMNDSMGRLTSTAFDTAADPSVLTSQWNMPVAPSTVNSNNVNNFYSFLPDPSYPSCAAATVVPMNTTIFEGYYPQTGVLPETPAANLDYMLFTAVNNSLSALGYRHNPVPYSTPAAYFPTDPIMNTTDASVPSGYTPSILNCSREMSGTTAPE
ncbi:hypothetical protein AAF712_015287 [Marasmius tenuissimus]|uniref:Uncharacterized protein n=1 Tax=Marasmius tenuissimus TaxID=585030 RepID=A0ABR2Z8N1_9AGAR